MIVNRIEQQIIRKSHPLWNTIDKMCFNANNLKYDNPYLREWLDDNDFYTIHYLKGDYVNCNYHKIDRSKDVEVLITNY